MLRADNSRLQSAKLELEAESMKARQMRTECTLHAHRMRLAYAPHAPCTRLARALHASRIRLARVLHSPCTRLALALYAHRVPIACPLHAHYMHMQALGELSSLRHESVERLRLHQQELDHQTGALRRQLADAREQHERASAEVEQLLASQEAMAAQYRTEARTIAERSEALVQELRAEAERLTVRNAELSAQVRNQGPSASPRPVLRSVGPPPFTPLPTFHHPASAVVGSRGTRQLTQGVRARRGFQGGAAAGGAAAVPGGAHADRGAAEPAAQQGGLLESPNPRRPRGAQPRLA